MKQTNEIQQLNYNEAVERLSKRLPSLKMDAFGLSFLLCHIYDRPKERILDDILRIRRATFEKEEC